MKEKIQVFMALFMASTLFANAGGYLTNTNHNIAFNRNFARVGTIGIDGVYSNPAGVAFLDKGFHLSLNFQNVYQTRIIKSSITIPALSSTPFGSPFKLNSGDSNGRKEYIGKAAVPILPSLQLAKNYDKWGFQLAFGVFGGGGKASFNSGLPSFERLISLLPMQLNAKGILTTTPGYSFSSYIAGQQYNFGLQLGATYKLNDHLAVYGGARFNYISNRYEGNIVDITANIAGTNQRLYDYFSDQSIGLNNIIINLKSKSSEVTDPNVKSKLEAKIKTLEGNLQDIEKTKEQVKDKYLECTQRGWGVTPIIGIDYRVGKWNFGARYEFTTRLNIENDTKRDDTGMFKNGVNTPNDLPGIFAIGTQYSLLDNLRLMASFHYYFDKDARMANDKQKLIKNNTCEYLAGVESDVLPTVTLSMGGQATRYGLGDGKYLSDLSFVTSSCSLGFGAKVKVAKNIDVNAAYFFTNYEKFTKNYNSTLPTPKGNLKINNSDEFTRTNKVLGVGVDINF